MHTIGDLLPSFLRDLRALQRSTRTIEAYTYSVDRFCDYLGTSRQDTPIDALTRENLKGWIEKSLEKWEPSTIRTHFAAVSRFCGWLTDEEYLDTNPSLRIPLPAEKTEAPEILTDDELQRILKSRAGKDFTCRRDTAIVRVLLDTGVRASELMSMSVSGTDLDGGLTRIRGKGSKIRNIYFSSRTIQALDRYIRTRTQHKLAKLDDLWLTQRGPMSTGALRVLMAQLGTEAGIPGLHAHRFRHTWAHDHLLNETSTVDLKRLAGWSTDAMLSRYGASGADVRAAATARRQSRGDRV